jgi:hypothetical protein
MGGAPRLGQRSRMSPEHVTLDPCASVRECRLSDQRDCVNVLSRAAVCSMRRNCRLDPVIASERIAGERIAFEQQDLERR